MTLVLTTPAKSFKIAEIVTQIRAEKIDVYTENEGTVTPTPDPKPEPDPTPDPEPSTDPFAKEIEVGKAYKFFINQEGLGKVLYFTGAMDGYYGATTEVFAEGVDVFFEANGTGYSLYFMQNEVKKYPDAFNIENKLNAEQKYTVASDEISGLVVAGAGCGKTSMLISKIAYLLKKGVNPDEILVLSYTNRTVDDMKTRLEHFTTVKPTTIHAFCKNEILKNKCRVQPDLLDKVIKKVIDLNANDKLLAQMMSREKFIRDQQAEEFHRKKQLEEIEFKKKEVANKEKELKEAEEKLESTLKDSKLEIARNMKSLGLDIEVISKTTSLSVEEISKL
jgi:hypothetical protein